MTPNILKLLITRKKSQDILLNNKPKLFLHFTELVVQQGVRV